MTILLMLGSFALGLIIGGIRYGWLRHYWVEGRDSLIDTLEFLSYDPAFDTEHPDYKSRHGDSG